MSCVGVLPKLDGAIFADTQWEPKAVYEWLIWLEEQAMAAGIPLYRVSKGNLRQDALESEVRGKAEDGKRWASMPLYTLQEGASSEGQIRRQCTSEYKIQPITKKLRELTGTDRPKAGSVELWFGISADEKRRIRMSPTYWITNHYPLVFDLDRPLHRHDCLVWMASHGFPTPPRSACIACPYHSNDEWREIQKRPAEWADVVEFDAAIRDSGGLRGKVFVHRSCKPLPMVDLETMEEKGQQNWLNECEGMCGV